MQARKVPLCGDMYRSKFGVKAHIRACSAKDEPYLRHKETSIGPGKAIATKKGTNMAIKNVDEWVKLYELDRDTRQDPNDLD